MPTPTAAETIVDRLRSQGVPRLYGLCGGHILPIWDAAHRRTVEVVDVRHEGSAVYMAHAESEVGGGLGVAVVTAGPGVTNAVTGIANAALARVPVLVLAGRVPRPQHGIGAMQDIPQAEVVAPLCRRVETVSDPYQLLPKLESVIAAALGCEGPAGPAFLEIPVDLLAAPVPAAILPAGGHRRRQVPAHPPDGEAVNAARSLIAGARRPLVIGGRAARACRDRLVKFLDATGACYLDTAESRGSVPESHPSYVPAVRGRVMGEADLVITLGRRLDFQLGYGSQVIFSSARNFIRIGRWFEHTGGNRRGDVEIWADEGQALNALLERGAISSDIDSAWADDIRRENACRRDDMARTLSLHPPGADGRMHPYRLFATLGAHAEEGMLVVADGGDILSFARVGCRPGPFLDCGALGCLGVGVPFAVGAALNNGGAPVVAVIGDGAFGFTAAEVNTAVRRKARVLFVVANNEAWNIERHDQARRFGSRFVGVDLPGCRYDLVARGFGAYAERVEDADKLNAAVQRCMARLPALLDVIVTRDAISPDTASGLAEVPDLQALRTWNDAEARRHHVDAVEPQHP